MRNHANGETVSKIRKREYVLSPNDLMTGPEIRALFSISESTFYRWKARDDFPKAIKFNAKAVRYIRKDVMTFFESAMDQ